MPQTASAAPPTAVAGAARRALRCAWRDDQLGAAWIDAIGDIDHASAPSLARALDQAQLGGARVVVLDLRDAALLDATGSRLIRAAAARARLRGDQLVVAHGEDQLDVSSAFAQAAHVEVCQLASGEPSVQALLHLAAKASRAASAA